MGRKVQTARRFKTSAARDKWAAKKPWALREYLPKNRQWAVLTGTRDLVMVDKEKIVDWDGDELYRIVYAVDHMGRPSVDHGFVRVHESSYARAAFVAPIADEATQTALDAWVRSAKEDVPQESAEGFRYATCQIEPCPVAVPGWERITKEENAERTARFIEKMVARF
jgi:hypothetical protein